MKNILLLLSLTICSFASFSQKNKEATNGIESSIVSGLKFRLVGPAKTSGRIADIAIHPNNLDTWYIAAASGGVWKTVNHGITFEPIFDSYASYSIGCVTVAPTNMNTVWVGTGENNNQRSVAYGDGVYKSLDGGKSFKNMGLKTSEHIGKIIVHPTNENIVWVAAYGPVWSKGGERGVYKTTDGGKTWKQTLEISEHTGIAEIDIDPENPNILYASAHQRRRREWTYIGGGPESGLYKSTDGGESWREINNGLPSKEMGRIGISVSPADPDYIYAIVEARGGDGGFYQSTNKGESWSKMSDYSTSGNYYQEIICDLTDRNKVFSMNTYLHHTIDGGKNFLRTGEKHKHVDNHTIWIDPTNPNHWIVGCDGGIYETYNHAKEWRYFDNLPLTQFYKVAADNSLPFYNIYGGTQDNNSMGGPSRTINNAGILNTDWYITNGGDGFESAIDPTDPNIVYAQAQYGWIVRYDKASGEKVPIQPLPEDDNEGYRWNWDAPLLISPHDNKTLYFCANKVFKSTNRGDDWETISEDLSQQIDRNKLEVMDQVWAIDMVEKNMSTTMYGNIVAFDESPIKKGLLYAGTDDGLIQTSTNDGSTWSKIGEFPGVPANTRINMIIADLHDENTVYATINNHRSGDFKPYVVKSTDQGKSWTSITGDLPESGAAFAIRQDHLDPNLLFVGTEFGCYFSNNGGENWTKLAGLPTIAVYDIELQKRESDVVIATFGRGFYVLDDYSPLRELTEETLEKETVLFPVKDALQYIPSAPLGRSGTGSNGHNLWNAENPKFGAVFSIYVKETDELKKDIRKKKERELEENGEAVPYPNFDDLLKENQEEKAKFIWVIRDDIGNELKRFTSTPKKGISRVNWDLRMAGTYPIDKKSKSEYGYLVTPGKYSVEVYKIKNGMVELAVNKTPFTVNGLNNQTLLATDNAALTLFRMELAESMRVIAGADELLNETVEQLAIIKNAIITYPGLDLKMLNQVEAISVKLDECAVALNGDDIRSKYQFEKPESISDRIWRVGYELQNNTTGLTNSQRKNKDIAEKQFDEFKVKLDECIVRLKGLEKVLEDAGIPYIPGKDENWKED